MKKFVAVAMGILLAASVLAGCGGGAQSAAESTAESTAASTAESTAQGGKVYKFALISNGPINDGDWNENGWRGLQKAQAKYGEDVVQISYSENVAQADYDDTFYGYAKDGYDLVIGNGFEFSEACFSVCDEFPDTKFAIVNGLEYRDNVCAFEFDNVEFGYMAGAAMALVAEERGTNCAFICAEAIPSYRNFYLGMEAGIKAVSDTVTSTDYYTGDWTDITKGSDVAKNAIANNEKVMCPWIGAVNHAIFTVCDENDCLFVNTAINLSEPELQDNNIMTITQDLSELICAGCSTVVDGNYPANGFLSGSFSNGLNSFGGFGEVMSEENQKTLTEIYEGLCAGTIDLPEKFSE